MSSSFSCFPGRIIRFPDHFFDDCTAARILQVAQAELHRIGARRLGELVHERLDAEDVAERAERAQRRAMHRRFAHVVVHHQAIRKVVAGDGIALSAARGQRGIGCRRALEWLRQLAGGDQHRLAGTSGAVRVAVAPEIVAPGDDRAARVELRLERDDHRRAVRLPGELVLARPLQADRLSAGKARQQRRIERHVVGAVVAVAARALGMAHDHVLLRHAHHHGDLLAQPEDALRMRPDFQHLALHARKRARRPDRGVADERLVIFGLQAPHAARLRPGIRLLLGDVVLRRMALQPAVDILRHRRPVAPYRFRTQLLRRLDRVLLALGDDRSEIAIPQDPRMIRNRNQFRKRPWRTQDARVKHAGQHDVLHVARPAGDLRRQVDAHGVGADDLVLRRRLLQRVGGNIEARDLEVPVAPLLRPLQKRTQLRARLAQALAAVLDREAAGSHALVRAVGSARRQDPYFLERQTKLVGGDLRQRGRDALPQLHLAGGDRNRAVALEVHALRQPPRVGERQRLVSGLVHAMPS